MGTEGNGHAPIGVEPRQRLLRAMPVVERQLDIGGISTTVLEGGAGSPIVLLHGPAAQAASAGYGWPLHVIEGADDDLPIEQPEALLRVLGAATSIPADGAAARVGR